MRAAVGVSLDILPRRLAESEPRTFPNLTAHVRFGLPAGFSVAARARAVYVSNQLELGGIASHRLGPVSLAVHDYGGVWFGALGLEGFDASAWAMVNAPGASIGLDVYGSRLTLSSEVLLMFARHVTLGDIAKATGKNSAFAGLHTSLLVESSVGRSGSIYYGVGLLWTRPQYEAWIAFSDSRGFLGYPRLVGGYAF